MHFGLKKNYCFPNEFSGKFKLNLEYPIFANQPTNPSQIISDIRKHTHRPNHQISYVDGPLGYKEVTYLFRKPKAILKKCSNQNWKSFIHSVSKLVRMKEPLPHLNQF